MVRKYSNELTDPNYQVRTEVVSGNPAQDEVQSITPSSVPSAGTFTITFDDTRNYTNPQTTAPLAWNADGTAITTALEALSNI